MHSLSRLSYSPDTALFFVHIPKTAGLSLHWAMVNAFPADRVARIHSAKEILRLPVMDLHRLSFLSAHARYGHYRLFTKAPFTLTVLRAPVERTISAYWHLRNENPANFENPEFREAVRECQVRTIEEIVFDPKSTAIGQFRNVQTWYLSGPKIEPLSTLRCSSSPTGTVGEHYRISEGRKRTQVGASELSAAKETIRALPLFGIVESMKESLEMIEEELGLDRRVVPTINVGKLRKTQATVPARVRERIAEINSLDQDLYSFAADLFGARLREASRNRDGFRPFSVEAAEGAPFVEIERNVSEGIIGGGWYPREAGNDDSWCWNGFMPYAWIDIFMEVKSDLEVMLEIAHCVDWAFVRQTPLAVNGTVLPTRFKRSRRGGILKANVPRALTGDGAVSLRISVAVHDPTALSEVPQGGRDHRKLCFALRRFRVRPI